MLRLTNISKCKALENKISSTLSYLALFASILLTACKNPDDIIQAARFGDLTKLKGCIESGISVDHVDPAGETALFHVIGSGSSDAFELLLNNLMFSDAHFPLFDACSWRKILNQTNLRGKI